MRRTQHHRWAVIALPYAWLLIFFLLPFLIVLKISVSEMDIASVKDVVAFQDGRWSFNLQLSTYWMLLQDDLYLRTYGSSLQYAAVTTAICLLIGYPFAYFMARARPAAQAALLMLVMLPFWTSFLLRVYAWKGLLAPHGWVANGISAAGIDRWLLSLHWIAAEGQLINTAFSLVLGMTYTYLPFMVLPLFANLAKMDLRLFGGRQ